MAELAIRAEKLGKRYVIRPREAYGALRDTLARAAAGAVGRALGRNPDGDGSETRTIWALKNVSFEVEQGEVVGVIGLNGAGKSTLLKVLSRITEPTEGQAEVRGRVGSLLEVGTGFHPELTGIENIYLNGAILGMRRAEICRKIDEIVAFAEIHRFVNTPLKRYSTGMYMRLAFAVAAHLDFEILLVDEVLAVGDLLFQRKCLRRMRDVSQEGRTVLFVSHNMAAIGMLTRNCLWLDGGRLVEQGETEAVLRRYVDNPFQHRGVAREGSRGYADLTGPACRLAIPRFLEREVLFQSIRLLNGDGVTTDIFSEGEPIAVELTIDVRTPIRVIDLLCRVRRAEGVLVFTALTGKRWDDLAPGAYRTVCRFAPNHLRPGWYSLELSLVTGAAVKQDVIPEAIAFNVVGKVEQDGDPRYAREAMGVIRVEYPWTPYVPVEAGSGDSR